MADRKTEFWDIESVSELRRRFQKPGWALRLFEWLRWPDGRFCPHCGSLDHLPIKGRQKTGLYHCRDCRKQFSATSGTPLHKTKLPIETWMEAAFLIASSSKGVSSIVLAKQLGVQQKTAWKIGHAIRLMMKPPADEPKLSGVVEVDDMTLGEDPKRTNRRRHGAALAQYIHNPPGRGSRRPAPSWQSSAVAEPRPGQCPTVSRLLSNPDQGDGGHEVVADDRWRQDPGGRRQKLRGPPPVNHSAGEYARGDAHVNTVEAFHLFTQARQVRRLAPLEHDPPRPLPGRNHLPLEPSTALSEAGCWRSNQAEDDRSRYPYHFSDAGDFPQRRRPQAHARGHCDQRNRAQDIGFSPFTCCVLRLRALRNGLSFQ